MSKSILMSIQPKWVAKILNGEKTIEVRKKFPKDYVGWVYIYCTKEDSLSRLIDYPKNKYVCEQNFEYEDFPKLDSGYEGKGKVVGRFWCDKVEEIYCQLHFDGYALETDDMSCSSLCKKSCLTEKELREYFNRGVYTFDETYGYAIHITKLEVFDKPKELKEFKARHYPQFANMEKNTIHYELVSVNKAPQSWCYVEGE